MNTKNSTARFRTAPDITATTPLICLWRSTGKPGAPLVCVWQHEPRTTANIVEFPVQPDDGLCRCA